MDDDPEPVILESHETLLTFGEQKCAAGNGEESPLESGDVGPALDPDSPKKPLAAKDLPVQTESKASIFRKKEWKDQTELADPSDGVKSSTISLRKPSRRSSQRLLGQESRRSIQQPASQKPSRDHVNEADVKDPTWVSQRTGKLMKSRSQQTNLIWEEKALSEILHPSSNESIRSKDHESDFTSEYEFTTGEDDIISGETDQEPCPGGKTLERKVSKLSNVGSRRKNSQQSSELPKNFLPTKEMDTDEDVAQISQRTSGEVESTTQETTEQGRAGFRGPPRYGYHIGQEEESGYITTDEVTSSGETEIEGPTTEESCHNSPQQGSVPKLTRWQHLGKSRSHTNSQQTKEQPCLLNSKSSHEERPEDKATEEEPSWISQRTGKEMKCRAQQTSLIWENETKCPEDSANEEEPSWISQRTGKQMKCRAQQTSRIWGNENEYPEDSATEEEPSWISQRTGKQMKCRGQQTSLIWESETSSDILCVHGKESDASEGSRGQDTNEDPRSETKTTEEDEAKVPPDTEREPSPLDQKASCVQGAEETIWVSRKTGRLVRNQSQQTDQSWLQYFTSKSQKLKKCISQQTDKSFLHLYKVLKAHRISHAEPDIRKCSLCGEVYGPEFSSDLDTMTSFSSTSVWSSFSSQVRTVTESAEETNPCTSEDDEGQSQSPQASQGSDQQVGRQESPKSVGQESRRASLVAAEDPILVKWAKECENSTTSHSSSLYTEEKSQQTYSVISLESGIWLNRRTGKLLVTHSQQTSKTSMAMDLERSGSTAEDSPAHTEGSDQGLSRDLQLEMEVVKQRLPSLDSRCCSLRDQNGRSCLLPEIKRLQIADEAEKLVCSRLSEATLLSVEFPDGEDGPVQIYSTVSLERGSWMNIHTGRLVESQAQQTEASFPPNSTEDEIWAKVPCQTLPEEGQVHVQQCSPVTA